VLDSRTIPTPAEMVARARALIPVLRERAPKGERERRLPKETITDMQAAGLFKVLQPKRWGGYELDIHTYFNVQMALAEGDMSVAWVYGVVGVHPWFVALLNERGATEIWGRNNASLLCSSLMPSGTAKPVNGGFRISGRWKYASGCERSSTPGTCPASKGPVATTSPSRMHSFLLT
jgi:3-hydroxy-9,10-secoandrosta-1,3,5(10)-triene-9,17-dione monooxygenase